MIVDTENGESGSMGVTLIYMCSQRWDGGLGCVFRYKRMCLLPEEETL